MRIRHVQFAVILQALCLVTATDVAARYDQSGYPARCHVYRVCDQDTCIKPTLPLYELILVNENEDYLFVGRGGEPRVKVEYFETLQEAKISLEEADTRNFGFIVVPNVEIADAFGMSAYSDFIRNGKCFMSNAVTKLYCSKIKEGLE